MSEHGGSSNVSDQPADGDQIARNSRTTRRDFLIRAAAAAAATPAIAAEAAASAQPRVSGKPAKQPNLLMIISDEFRWDFVGAYGLNPMGVTPNLDAMARRGVAFENMVTNQPLCSPSRACLFTGQYATTTGVWRLGPGLRPGVPTLATALRGEGYTCNYIGKWHLAPHEIRAQPIAQGKDGKPEGLGFVPREYRGGFLDLWQASNVIERTSKPYEGTIWNGDGEPMHYKDIYRVDYLTDLAVRFLRRPQKQPFFLVVSQLEPHEENELGFTYVPPKKYQGRYTDPFVPRDLSFYPGIWQTSLPGYYGDIKAIDDSVGVLMKTLSDEGLAEDTIVVFVSDHGDLFHTRGVPGDKCTPHEGSIHVPLLIQGPGFDQSRMIPELVSMVDLTPSLLAALGAKIPDSVQGKSFLPVLQSRESREQWQQEAFIQFSSTAIGRALRTPEWTYGAIDPTRGGYEAPSSTTYQDHFLYNLAADPHELVNLSGRENLRATTDHLRERLIQRMVEAGEAKPTIKPRPYHLYS